MFQIVHHQLLFGNFEVFLQDLVNSMEEEMNATVSSCINSSSNSNLSNTSDSKVSYLSNIESNITILSGIFPLPSQITSSSFSNIITDRSKVCI